MSPKVNSLVGNRLTDRMVLLFLMMFCSFGEAAVTPFRMVIFGDTQRYPQVINAGGPDLFTIQTKWVKEHAAAENIQFLTHVGDVIQDNAALWAYADTAMSELDGVLPYGVTFGNHDGGAPNVFGTERYAGEPWYVGGSADGLAHAQLFSGGGIAFLHINLPHSPSVTHLNWAQGVIDSHVGKPTIITTHGYFADNGSGRDANGTKVWNALVEPNAQVFMTCCGHDWVSRHELDTTTDGRKVIQVMVNMQEIINGGNGWLQLVTFDPDVSEIRFQTYSPFLDLYRTDYTGEFNYSVTFGVGSVTVNGDSGLDMRLWNGGGVDGSWSAAANWGGMAPVAGDVLEFRGTTRKVSTNDFPVGTSFGGIVFSPGKFSNGYVFGGNGVTLTGDIVNMGGYGPNVAQSGPVIQFPITLVGDRQVNTGDWDMTIEGVIGGSGSLTKTHGRDYVNGSFDGGVHIGDLYLTSVNTYTGATKVTGGALGLINNGVSNLMPSSPEIEIFYNAVLLVSGLKDGEFEVAGGQVVRGTGKVIGDLLVGAGGELAPGHAKAGAFVQIGDLGFESGATFGVRLGEEFDRVEVTGAVDLGGATLNFTTSGGAVPKVGDSYVIVQNDGVDAVVDTFVSGVGSDLVAGSVLTEGSILTTNFLGSGLSASISYVGGSGNDVVITVLPGPGAPHFTEDPLDRGSAEVDVPYRGTIAGSALDGDGDALTYSKLSGPAWLTVNPGGSLSGVPTVGDLGVNEFVVEVSDGSGVDVETLRIEVVSKRLVGQWDFDDVNDLTKATVGNDLVLVGNDQAVSGTGSGDGAASIGVGSHYSCAHGIGANGGGSFTNEYTLVMDVRYPASSAGKWISLFQTSSNNGNDGDFFVRNSNATVGVAATGYSSWSFPAESWVRLAVSVKSGEFYRIYADGVLIKTGNVQVVDGRFSLEPNLLFFADNDGEDNVIEVSSIRVYRAGLSEGEVAALGDSSSSDHDGDGIADEVDPDDDNDGMDDAWEVGRGLDPFFDDGEVDSDGDGVSNMEEYLADTDPLDVGDLLGGEMILTMDGVGGELVLATSAGRYYSLESNATLAAGGWVRVGQPFLGGGGGMTLAVANGGGKRFYRVRVSLP